jgi:hypothetical protein
LTDYIRGKEGLPVLIYALIVLVTALWFTGVGAALLLTLTADFGGDF